MIFPGLASVTLRQWPADKVAALAREAGLLGVEWGGDVHVPHGDLVQARRVRALTDDAGLQTVSYGSYYRVGHPDEERFKRVLLTAVTLGAPLIRVWAGKRPFRQADNAYWGQVLADAENIALLAAEHNIQIAFEFHSNTLADSAVGARQLLQELADYGLFSYWQPPVLSSEEENAATLTTLAPWLRHLHVFSWREVDNRVERLPLAARREAWLRYLQLADELPGNRFALLEFVRDDDPAQLMQDAASLHGFLSVIGNQSGY